MAKDTLTIFIVLIFKIWLPGSVTGTCVDLDGAATVVQRGPFSDFQNFPRSIVRLYFIIDNT